MRSSRRRSSRASIAVGDSSLTRAAASSIASGRQSSVSQISPIASRSGLVGPHVRAHGACPLEEERHGVVASKRLERELLLAAHAQSGTARYGDLQIRARGDDRGKRRGRIDDLLEVVEDEEQPTAFEMYDESLLEISLAVEEPERPRDRADHMPGSLTDWSGTSDDPVSEAVCRRRSRPPARASSFRSLRVR